MRRGEAETILVVEDDVDARDILRWLLESAGYRVHTAWDGGEALRILKQCSVDLILLDMQMPGMDGWQFRERQRRDPELADIPVIVLTGDRRAAEDAKSISAAGCLRKPVDMAELLPVVAKHTEARPATRS